MLRMPTFATPLGQKTIRPSGSRVHPPNLPTLAVKAGPRFENERVVGLNIPMLAESQGEKTTLPVGSRAAPVYK